MSVVEPRWTTKLLYRRYTHVVQIACDHRDDPRAWAKQNLRSKFRTHSEYAHAGRQSMSFYTDAGDHSLLVAEYADRVLSVRRPFNQEAERLLLSGVEISLREKLYYNRYRYSVRLYCKNGTRTGLVEWVRNCLGSDNRQLRLGRGTYFPILYLRDESDMVMVRLAEPANVIGVVRAWTFEDLTKQLP
jgi:hypothetical protein